MTVETVLTYSEATADEALKALRSLRGYPLCGHRELADGLFTTCVLGKGHDDGAHE